MSDRPNILLILTDQHRLSAMGCYGETPCRTPNLDALAKDGIRFETTYTSCPVCSPARASIMTGLYPHQHGICSNVGNLGASVHELPDSPQLLSRRLLETGYRCGYTGKWHLGSASGKAFGTQLKPSLPKDLGFEGQNFPGHGGGGFNYPEYKDFLSSNGFTHQVTHLDGVSYNVDCNGIIFGTLSGPVQSTVPYYLTTHTIETIDKMAESEDPFFMWHNFWGPHGPYYVPEAYFEAYRNVDIPEWPNYRWEDADRNTPHQVKLHPKRNDLTWEDWADAVRHYYAFTTLIDEQIGRMIDHLRKNGLLENTIIIFAADHGETIGSHGGLTDKGWHHFEEIQRIPLIIRPPDSWPNPERDVVRSEWASLLDLYPTLLDLASAGESETPGLSLRPFIEGDSAPWRNEIFVEFSGVNSLATSMVTARKSHIKYGWNCSSHDELYDLDKDPWELCNLVEDSEYAGQLFNMRRLVADWMEETRYPGRGMYVHSRIH